MCNLSVSPFCLGSMRPVLPQILESSTEFPPLTPEEELCVGGHRPWN
jgi:hypothetical protein